MEPKTPKEARDEIITNVTQACSDGAKRVMEIYEKMIYEKTGIDIKINYTLECKIPNKLIDELYISGNDFSKLEDVKEPFELVREKYIKWKM